LSIAVLNNEYLSFPNDIEDNDELLNVFKYSSTSASPVGVTSPLPAA
jgi:hypothetical protein